MNLTDYRTLGHSGLIVSPMALGTMTFGNRGWGSPDGVSEQIFETYLDAGGNFIDTADVYSGGRSEELLGQFISDRQLRDRVVLSTKFGFTTERGNPNAGGNGRKQIHRALEGSLRRLKTDFIDLYWMHAWDTMTPVEEVLQTLSDLVRAGTIRYFGFSNMPAWYAVKAATLADAHNAPRPIAMQLEYSLVARGVEIEHLSAALASGMGIVPWSPLAGGFLAGKYSRDQVAKQGRLSGANPFGDSKFTAHNWQVLDVLHSIATEQSRPPAQVALAWTLRQPAVTAPILGASRPEQLRANLASLKVALSETQLQRLNEVSVFDPMRFTHAMLKRAVFAGASIEGWR